MTDSSVPASAQSISRSLPHSSPAALALTSGSSASSYHRAFACAFPLPGMFVAQRLASWVLLRNSQDILREASGTPCVTGPPGAASPSRPLVTALRVRGSYGVDHTTPLWPSAPAHRGCSPWQQGPLPLFPHPGAQGRGRACGCTRDMLVD